MISTHLSTFKPEKQDFAKHAQPQPKKLRAYKTKKVYVREAYTVNDGRFRSMSLMDRIEVSRQTWRLFIYWWQKSEGQVRKRNLTYVTIPPRFMLKSKGTNGQGTRQQGRRTEY